MFRIVFALVLIISSRVSCEFPSSIPRCPKDDTFDDCLMNVIHEIRPLICSGDYGDGFVAYSMDPVQSEATNVTMAGLNVELYNLGAVGLGNYTVKSVTSNLRKLLFEFNAYVPRIEIESNYKFLVKILKNSLLGGGVFKGNLTDISGKIRVQLDVEEIDGVRFVRYKSASLKFKISDLDIDWTNDVNQDRILNNFAKELILSKKRIILDTMTPLWEEIAASRMVLILQVLFRSCRYDELFAQNEIRK